MLKNKFKKYAVTCLAVLGASAMIQSSVFASVDGFSALIDGKHVDISYDVPAKGYGTLVYVFDTKVKDTDEINEDFLKEHLVYQNLTHENTVSFTLPESDTRLYTVIFGGAGFSGDKMNRLEYIFAVSQTELNTALADIKSASGDDIYDALAMHNDQMYAVDIADYAENKSLVAEVFEALDYVNNLNTTSDVSYFVDKVKLVDNFADMSADEMAAAILETPVLFGTEDIPEDELSLVSKAVYDLHDKGESLDTIADIRNVITRANAVCEFNSASNENRLDIVREYSDIFGIIIDEDDINKVTEREINKILGSSDVTTPEELERIYSDAMDKLLEEAEDEDSGSSGGSGGGGGGSRGSGGGSAAYIPAPTLEPEKVDEIRGDSKLYTDTEGYEWADEAIKMLNSKGVMAGDGSGLFRPDNAITREEFVKIVVSGFGLDTSDAQTGFADVPSDAWYAPYVAGACSAGIVNGLGNGTFGTGESITRQDAAVIITRACELKYKKFNEIKSVVEFVDYADIAEYAHYAVAFLAKSGILNGYEDGCFRPLGVITRAEAAKLLYGCIK